MDAELKRYVRSSSDDARLARKHLVQLGLRPSQSVCGQSPLTASGWNITERFQVPGENTHVQHVSSKHVLKN